MCNTHTLKYISDSLTSICSFFALFFVVIVYTPSIKMYHHRTYRTRVSIRDFLASVFLFEPFYTEPSPFVTPAHTLAKLLPIVSFFLFLFFAVFCLIISYWELFLDAETYFIVFRSGVYTKTQEKQLKLFIFCGLCVLIRRFVVKLVNGWCCNDSCFPSIYDEGIVTLFRRYLEFNKPKSVTCKTTFFW